MSKARKRAVAPPHGDVGSHRYKLYARIRDQIEAAKRDGYLLEAITLIESVLTDRLESRAGFLTKKNQGFSTLGSLTRLLGKLGGEESFQVIVCEIDQWREQRNKALHELAKDEEGLLETWEQKISGLGRIVEAGQQLLCRFVALDEYDRASKPKVRPPATWPNVFAKWCTNQPSTDAHQAAPEGRPLRGRR
jgi:hypothetical protein